MTSPANPINWKIPANVNWTHFAQEMAMHLKNPYKGLPPVEVPQAVDRLITAFQRVQQLETPPPAHAEPSSLAMAWMEQLNPALELIDAYWIPAEVKEIAEVNEISKLPDPSVLTPHSREYVTAIKGTRHRYLAIYEDRTLVSLMFLGNHYGKSFVLDWFSWDNDIFLMRSAGSTVLKVTVQGLTPTWVPQKGLTLDGGSPVSLPEYGPVLGSRGIDVLHADHLPSIHPPTTFFIPEDSPLDVAPRWKRTLPWLQRQSWWQPEWNTLHRPTAIFAYQHGRRLTRDEYDTIRDRFWDPHYESFAEACRQWWGFAWSVWVLVPRPQASWELRKITYDGGSAHTEEALTPRMWEEDLNDVIADLRYQGITLVDPDSWQQSLYSGTPKHPLMSYPERRKKVQLV